MLTQLNIMTGINEKCADTIVILEILGFKFKSTGYREYASSRGRWEVKIRKSADRCTNGCHDSDRHVLDRKEVQQDAS